MAQSTQAELGGKQIQGVQGTGYPSPRTIAAFAQRIRQLEILTGKNTEIRRSSSAEQGGGSDIARDYSGRSEHEAVAEMTSGTGSVTLQGQGQQGNAAGNTQAKLFQQEKAREPWTLPLKYALAAGLLATITDSTRSGEDVLRIVFGVVVYLVVIGSIMGRV